MTVREAIASSCSTAPLAGLSAQLIAEIDSLAPGVLVPIASPLVQKSNTAHLVLQEGARASLMHVLSERPGKSLVVNSCYRTLVEQLAVYTWYKAKTCGITLAAKPGASAPHSLGVALDVQEHNGWRAAFETHGWVWQGEKDPMHFTFSGLRRPDLGTLSVKAAQLLLNKHGAQLAVDGVFGLHTEGMLFSAPAAGWSE